MEYSREEWKEVGKKLAIARQRRRISQRQISDSMGICQTRISEIETGKVIPRQEELDAILNEIGISAEEMFATQGRPIFRRDGRLLNEVDGKSPSSKGGDEMSR